MKISKYDVICSDCDYQRDLFMQKNFRNPYANEPFGPVVKLMWCNVCDGVVQVACIPCKKDYEEHLQTLDRILAKSKPKGIFSALAKLSKNTSSEENKIQSRIDSLTAAAKLANDARVCNCLVCGSLNVKSVTMPDPDFFEYNTIDVDHKCGGLILAKRLMYYHVDPIYIDSKHFPAWSAK